MQVNFIILQIDCDLICQQLNLLWIYIAIIKLFYRLTLAMSCWTFRSFLGFLNHKLWIIMNKIKEICHTTWTIISQADSRLEPWAGNWRIHQIQSWHSKSTWCCTISCSFVFKHSGQFPKLTMFLMINWRSGSSKWVERSR